MTAASVENPQAALIGKYRPILELGRGGMANVYLCVVRGLGGFSKLHVVKRLRPEFAEEPEFRSMFLEEARLAARINHPNVVQTYEVGMDGNNLFIAMEYLEGQSLEELIRRAAKSGKPLALSYCLPILVDALRGLHFAHELKDFQGHALKVIHRDVSPHNIFVTYDGQVKVVDFGIAKAADSSHETRTGVLKGKVAYMAPEQIAAKERVDRRADLFACGAILWRALVGKRLWRGMNDMEILVKITHGEIPSPTTEKEGLDPKLVDICMKALEPDPDKRYQSAEEMITALEEYIAAQPDHTTSREVGALVSELFADRRAEIAQAIEKRVGGSEDEAASWSELDLPNAAMSGPTFTPSHFSGSLDALGGVEPTLPAAGAVSGSVVPGSGGARGKRVATIAAGVALVAAAGAFALARSHHSSAAEGTPTPVTSLANTTAPAPTENATNRPEVQLQIKLSPADAMIAIDDKPLTAGARYYRDGAVHKVRVSADHYEPESRLVTFDTATVMLDFSLRKQPATVGVYRPPLVVGGKKKHEEPAASVAPPPPPVTVAVTTAAPPPPPPPTATATAGKLGIDSSNPWK